MKNKGKQQFDWGGDQSEGEKNENNINVKANRLTAEGYVKK
jgi:hypothetical protein